MIHLPELVVKQLAKRFCAELNPLDNLEKEQTEALDERKKDSKSSGWRQR